RGRAPRLHLPALPGLSRFPPEAPAPGRLVNIPLWSVESKAVRGGRARACTTVELDGPLTPRLPARKPHVRLGPGEPGPGADRRLVDRHAEPGLSRTHGHGRLTPGREGADRPSRALARSDQRGRARRLPGVDRRRPR